MIVPSRVREKRVAAEAQLAEATAWVDAKRCGGGADVLTRDRDGAEGAGRGRRSAGGHRPVRIQHDYGGNLPGSLEGSQSQGRREGWEEGAAGHGLADGEQRQRRRDDQAER